MMDSCLLILRLYSEAVAIKTVVLTERQTHTSVEQRTASRNRPTETQSVDFS